MKLYGVTDESGEIYAAYRSPDDVPGLDTVVLVENYTWEPSDWTDSETGINYIVLEKLAKLFNALCLKTGIKKKELAKICGKSAVQFSKYCNGISPVPRLVWEKVESYVRKEPGK